MAIFNSYVSLPEGMVHEISGSKITSQINCHVETRIVAPWLEM